MAEKFEESLQKLEKIVQKLEEGELNLDEALKQFEDGVKLTQALNQKIEESKSKVEELSLGKNGKVKRSAFADPSKEETDQESHRMDKEDLEEEVIVKPARAAKSKSKKANQDSLF